MATIAAVRLHHQRRPEPEAQIQSQTGYVSLPILRGCICRGTLFTGNTAAKIGLQA